MSHKISQYEDKIIVDDVIYPYPERVKNSGTNRLIVKDDLIVVNGYTLNLKSKTFSETPTNWMIIPEVDFEDEDVQLTHQEIAEGVGMIIGCVIIGALLVAALIGTIVYVNLI